MSTRERTSAESTDSRSISRIIFEKANFGGMPVMYKLAGDERWHTVQWTHNTDLEAIQFSDGSTVHVTPMFSTSKGTADKPPLSPTTDWMGNEPESNMRAYTSDVNEAPNDAEIWKHLDSVRETAHLDDVADMAAAVASEELVSDSAKTFEEGDPDMPTWTPDRLGKLPPLVSDNDHLAEAAKNTIKEPKPGDRLVYDIDSPDRPAPKLKLTGFKPEGFA
jgi:hypothetical protein